MNSSYQYSFDSRGGQTVVVVCRNRNIEMQSGTAVCYDHT
jgi:hypothetical protein